MNITRTKIESAIALLNEALDELNVASPVIHTGGGMFVRSIRQYRPYIDTHLDWVSVCVLTRGRAIARSDSFWQARRDAGTGLSGWDWFPEVDDPTRGLRAAVSFAAAQGATSFILNAEKDFRRNPEAARRYVEAAREATDEYGIALGLVSYSIPSTVKDFPWEEFAKHCDFGVPEVYDRSGKFDKRYPTRAIDSYLTEGFKRVIPACGIYQGRPTLGRWKWRWRTATETTRHLSLFPRQHMDAWIAWPLAGPPPEATLKALARGGSRYPVGSK